MNTIHKKLIEKGESEIKKQERLVEQAKLLLSSNAQEERTLLQNVGLNQEIEFFERQKINILDKKAKSQQYGKPVISLNDIKDICMTYRLYMRQSGSYIGKIPNELGAELVAFVKEHKIATGNHSNYSPFYIIAPPEMFQGHKNYVTELFEMKTKLTNAYIEKQKDPILLYKINEDNYVIVKSWGNDFSLVRRFKAFLATPFVLAVATIIAYITAWAGVEYIFYSIIPQLFNIDLFPEKVTFGDIFYSTIFIIQTTAAVLLSTIFLLHTDDGLIVAMKETFKNYCTKHMWKRENY